ncbi:hypothetical protein HK414_20355 [Ramlibacter terrae]|uniref:Uncharacterized protein n=1 Tax=Ramlibacter terrae TaxID=2732511 RepID=A0ABX6P6D9_9BURK|nr:hypothetical protein HK414_20355 [Ramlibacter terrae]
MFLPVPTLTRIVRAVGAHAVVATSAPRAERAALLAARALGVPSLCMVDLFAAYEIAWLQAPDFADRVCVLNERVRQRLVDAGRPPGHIAVTGNPAFDRLGDPEVRRRGRQLRTERGWDDRHVVLWASQVEPERHPVRSERGNVELPARIAQSLRAMLPSQPGMELVVRPHPSEPPSPQPPGDREWLSRRDEDLHVLLHAVDVVVVMTSTVGIEARLAGKRVVRCWARSIRMTRPTWRAASRTRRCRCRNCRMQSHAPSAGVPLCRVRSAKRASRSACGRRTDGALAAMKLRELPLPEAQRWFDAMPLSLRVTSLSPAFAAADATRDPQLQCRWLAVEAGEWRWLHGVHLRPLPGGPGAWGAISPYGYGGPLASAQDAALLAQAWAAYGDWCRANAVLAEFCRFHPEAGNDIFFGGEVADNRMTVSVDLTLPQVESQFSTLALRKLRRADRLGATVRFSRHPGDWRRFAAFYRAAMTALGAAGWYHFSDAYFEALATVPQAWLCVCELDGAWHRPACTCSAKASSNTTSGPAAPRATKRARRTCCRRPPRGAGARRARGRSTSAAASRRQRTIRSCSTRRGSPGGCCRSARAGRSMTKTPTGAAPHWPATTARIRPRASCWMIEP